MIRGLLIWCLALYFAQASDIADSFSQFFDQHPTNDQICWFYDLYPKQYVAYYTESPPAIDGNLDDPVWHGTPWTDMFVDIRNSSFPRPRFSTRAKMRWDEKYLYVAAFIQEPNIWAYLTKHDSVIFHDNDFEVFVNPDGTTHYYKEWEMNARNVSWDLCLNKPYLNGGYENSSRVFGSRGFDMEPYTVHSTALYPETCELNDPNSHCTHWVAEIAFDLSQLVYNETVKAPPKNGTFWRINFSRVEYEVEVKNGKYEPTNPNTPDNWVWSNMNIVDMHLPERWGILQFSTDRLHASPYFIYEEWSVRSVAFQLYYAQVAFHKQHQKYAETVSQLIDYAPAGRFALDGHCSKELYLTLTSTGWVAKVISNQLPAYEAQINNERLIIVEKLSS